VTEVTAPIDHATIAGFLPGDTLTLEGLGTNATPTLNVILKNGEAAVQVMEGSSIVDQVTFLGNFTTSTLGAPGGFTATNASSSINGGEITIGVAAPLALAFTSEILAGDDGQLTLTGTIPTASIRQRLRSLTEARRSAPRRSMERTGLLRRRSSKALTSFPRRQWIRLATAQPSVRLNL
jgi:hypothetical protein